MQIDITVNNLSAVASTTFLCDVFIKSAAGANSGLLPTCVRAIKVWAKFESEKYVGKKVIGGANQMLSSYCYTIMTVVIFTQFNPKDLLDFFQIFFTYYSEFDWNREVRVATNKI